MKLDEDDINSYRQRQYFDEPRSSTLNGTTIFFAVASAIIFCWFLKSAYEEWQIRRALAIFNEQMAITEIQTKNELRKMQIRTEAYKAQNEERIRLQGEQHELLRIQKHEAELAQQVIYEAQLAAKSAKEVARKSFYKPVAGCESDNPNRELIKCGNDYARANKKFEENWARNN
jgi:low affinity Fe/Cu permease